MSGNSSSRGGKGGGRGGKVGKGKGGAPKYGKGYTSPRAVRGPGIFATCWRGKEGRCVGELYDLLDETANRLYPPERLAELELLRPASEPKAAADAEPNAAPTEMEIPADAAMDSDSDDEDLDIETAIAKELEQLQSSTKKQKKSEGGDKGKAKTQKHRFLSCDTNTECLIFMSLAWPYDPVEIVEEIVKNLQATGVSTTRHVLRLEPVVGNCHSLTESAVKSTTATLIEKAFTDYAVQNNTTTLTYAIEPSVRSHAAPHNRDTLIALVGSLVRDLALPPPPNSSIPTRPTLTVSANLSKPDLVVLPCVLKNYYGISVVDGKLWKGGKKFNIDAIAAALRVSKAGEGETKSRVEVGKVKVDEKVGETMEGAVVAPVESLVEKSEVAADAT
ncbi:THUMP domain protein [Pseudohyphozyma bogoriensis]|nr:THUMP domain protein [Pseudohyphozyma bogoriensis]